MIIAHDSILYYKRYKIGKAFHRTKLFLTVKRECDNNFKQPPLETKFSHQLYFLLHRPVKFDFYHIWQQDSRVLRVYAIMLTKVCSLISIHQSFHFSNYILKRISDIQDRYNLKSIYSMWILDNTRIVVSTQLLHPKACCILQRPMVSRQFLVNVFENPSVTRIILHMVSLGCTTYGCSNVLSSTSFLHNNVVSICLVC